VTTPTSSSGRIALDAEFPRRFEQLLPKFLAPGALPDDWDPRATTYDLTRFDSDEAFAGRFAEALKGLEREGAGDPERVRAVLTGVGLPFDYARLGQPLSTIFELWVQAHTHAARCFSFASVTKPWLSVIESPRRTLPVRVYADHVLPVSDAKKEALKALGVTLHERWSGPLPVRADDVLTVFVTAQRFTGDVNAVAADAVCFPVTKGGVLLLRDTTRIAPVGIQLVRKRTVSALIASDARLELEKAAGVPATRFEVSTPEACQGRLQALFPEVRDSLYFCTGLAAEAAVFEAVADVLGPSPVTLYYAQNGYGGTGQLIAELLGRARVKPAPLAVLGKDASGKPVTLVDRVVASLEALGDAPACVFLENPTNPELQAHDFEALMRGLRAHEQKTTRRVPVIVDTTLAPLMPLFSRGWAKDWPVLLVKSGSKYFTRGKSTLGVVACAADALAQRIVDRARALGKDADSFARPEQLAHLFDALGDLAPRMKAISGHTMKLATGILERLKRRGHAITLYAITEAQVAEGLATGLLSFYLPAAPTTFPDLVDEFVDFLVRTAPALVKSRVSYGQSTGGGRPDFFYVINPEESTQGALSAAVKAAQKRDNVQICRVSVPELADVDGLLAAMEGFFEQKYGRAS
jgi:cystathionine beta-lyase/cystathionine gamma-synthase